MTARGRALAGIVCGLLLVTIGSAQELRAWQTLHFGDSQDVVKQKMNALVQSGEISLPGLYQSHSSYDEARSILDPNVYGYPLILAGLEVDLYPAFYDEKLYELRFYGEKRNASHWDTKIQEEYRTLREVLTRALGPPGESHRLDFFDMQNRWISYGDIWRDGGISRFLGIGENDSRYYVALIIEWDWMADIVRSQQESERDETIDDAAGGF